MSPFGLGSVVLDLIDIPCVQPAIVSEPRIDVAARSLSRSQNSVVVLRNSALMLTYLRDDSYIIEEEHPLINTPSTQIESDVLYCLKIEPTILCF